MNPERKVRRFSGCLVRSGVYIVCCEGWILGCGARCSLSLSILCNARALCSLAPHCPKLYFWLLLKLLQNFCFSIFFHIFGFCCTRRTACIYLILLLARALNAGENSAGESRVERGIFGCVLSTATFRQENEYLSFFSILP